MSVMSTTELICKTPPNQTRFRVLLTSDMHCTDLYGREWYGLTNEERMQHWVDTMLKEHQADPFDAIFIPGDISLDYHDKKTPYDKGYSTGQDFIKNYLSQLPPLPRFILPGNHEQFTDEDWLALTGNHRQGSVILGNNTFVMLSNFAEDLGHTYDSSDKYSKADVDYIRSQIEAHPQNNVYLVSHYFNLDLDSEAFRSLLKTETRIKGLFMGHTHLNRVLPLGEEYRNLVIAETGNFSYTLEKDLTKGFWGFRDLVITPDTAVSHYIVAESNAIIDGKQVHFDRTVVDTTVHI